MGSIRIFFDYILTGPSVHSIPPQSQHRAGLAGKYPVAPVCLSNIIFNCLIQIIVSKLIIFDCFIKIAQF